MRFISALLLILCAGQVRAAGVKSSEPVASSTPRATSAPASRKSKTRPVDPNSPAGREVLERQQPDAGLDSLGEDGLFHALDTAVSGERIGAIFRRIVKDGNLETANRLEKLESKPDMPPRWALQSEAAAIRFRITGRREFLVRKVTLGIENTCSARAVEVAADEGIVETRSQIIACTHDSVPLESGDDDLLKRYLVVLDLWDRAPVKTKEEVYAEAVELDDLQQKLWGLRKLTALPSVSPSIIARVNVVMKPRLAADRKFRSTLVRFPVEPADEKRLNVAYDVLCHGMRPFWEAHSKGDLDADWANGAAANDPTNCAE